MTKEKKFYNIDTRMLNGQGRGDPLCRYNSIERLRLHEKRLSRVGLVVFVPERVAALLAVDDVGVVPGK